MHDRKDRFIRFAEDEPTLPIFMQPWWLDAVVGPQSWDVSIVEQDGKVIAALPYVTRRFLHWRLLDQPPLTQHLGPWISFKECKRVTRYNNEHKLLRALEESLPKADRYLQNWSPQQGNYLPFYWEGYEASLSYTYVIRYQDSDLEANVDSRIRNDLKKARHRFGVEVIEKNDIDDFLRLNRLTFERQGMNAPHSSDLIRRLDSACADRGARTMFFATDETGDSVAATYIVWDASSAFYLMSGSDPDKRHLGAGTVALWESVLGMKDRTDCFNFEGSMIQPIEGHFRRFGGERIPYLSVRKTSSTSLRCVEALRRYLRRRPATSA